MEVQKFILSGKNSLNGLTAFISSHCGDGYQSNYSSGSFWAYEDYTILNNNYLIVCIRLDSTEAANGIIRIEAIAGGAADGFLKMGNWGSESRRLNKFRNSLIDYCEENNIDMYDDE